MFSTEYFLPDPSLRDLISDYLLIQSAFDGPFMETTILPHVNQNMVFNLGMVDTLYDINNQEYLPANVVVGSSNRSCRLRFYERMKGLVVNFKPLGWYKLFNLPVHPFSNRSGDLEEIIGREISKLNQQLRDCPEGKNKIQLLNAFFLDRLSCQKIIYNNMEEAVRLIDKSKGNITIKQLETDVFITKRTMERRFLEQTGLYPKMYARIVRFNETINYMKKYRWINWSCFANYLGYCDQSHLINEFKHFAGYLPGGYSTQPADFETALK